MPMSSTAITLSRCSDIDADAWTVQLGKRPHPVALDRPADWRRESLAQSHVPAHREQQDRLMPRYICHSIAD